jgi:hypothetical protein
VDVENTLDGQPEVYKPLRDALGDVPIAADNVVVLLVPHDFYSESPEIVEIQFFAAGPAYAFGTDRHTSWNGRAQTRMACYISTQRMAKRSRSSRAYDLVRSDGHQHDHPSKRRVLAF